MYTCTYHKLTFLVKQTKYGNKYYDYMINEKDINILKNNIDTSIIDYRELANLNVMNQLLVYINNS